VGKAATKFGHRNYKVKLERREFVSLVVGGFVATIRAFVLPAAFQEIGPRWQKKVFKTIFDVEPC
jgi:hypothetical protein